MLQNVMVVWASYVKIKISGRVLGQIQELEKGVQDMGRFPVGGSGGILSRKMFKIEVLTNGISAMVKTSQHVILIYFF